MTRPATRPTTRPTGRTRGRLRARASAILTAAAAGAAIALLAGCVSEPGGSHPVAGSTPNPTATAQLAVTIPMPDLGESPVTPPLSPEEKELKRVSEQDALWDTVLATYPGAVRPEIPFTEYVTDANRLDVRTSCFAAADLKVETGSTADGTIMSVSAQPRNEAEAVSGFICDAEHPNEPYPLPNEAVLSWVYDYLTQFVAPCYAANGIENPAPPTREDFVAQWPNQNWFPSLGDMPMGTPREEAIEDACPMDN